jgi:hypothetical protein
MVSDPNFERKRILVKILLGYQLIKRLKLVVAPALAYLKR